MDAMRWSDTGLRRVHVASKNFDSYTRADERSKQNVYKKNQTAIQLYLLLHVEKYIIQVALLSFLQLQPPKKTKPSPSQVVNAMLLQSLLLMMISITTSKNVRMAVCP